MATKQEAKREDYDEAIRQMKEDLDARFDEMEARLTKAMRMDRKTLEGEEDMMKELRHRFKAVGEKMNDGVDRADDLVRDHPIIAVGGALAVGLALGALLTRRDRD